MADRIVVTGIGIISSLGRGRAAHLAAVRAGRSGIRLLTSFAADELTCRIGGEVEEAALGSDFTEYDRFARLALIAAAEAGEQASLGDDSVDRERLATIIGTGLGGSVTLDAAYRRLYAEGQSRLAPTSIARAMYNAATSAVSRQWQALGPAMSTVSACASGTHAIGQAMHWIRSGMADVAIAGAADAPLITGIIRGWEAMSVLSVDLQRPKAACRPFSVDRKGLVLAEGAAVLILEREEHARARGVPILGEVAGFGMTSDAGHLTDPSSSGAARAMRHALRDASIAPADIDYINAHGTATKANDSTETRAIRETFGEHASTLPVSSSKSMHGHAMGASGAIEFALSLLALNEGVLPPTINWSGGDPDCDLDYVPNEARPTDGRTFMSNSFGFGGMNAVVVGRAN